MRVHNYADREQGTMVIGTAHELRAMANAVLAKLDESPEKHPGSWPPELWGQFAEGIQEINKRQYRFSVHLETESGDKPSAQFTRKYGCPMFIFALIGLWQLFAWAARLF